MNQASVFDIIPPEAARLLDKLGYGLLGANGYNVGGAAKSYKVRARLKDALKKRGEELHYKSLRDTDTGVILVWFELCRGDTVIARSGGVKFVPGEAGETDGDGTEDSKGQEGFEGHT